MSPQPSLNAAAPTFPATADRVLQQRVDYGYNLGIVVGLLNRDGRTIRGYGRLSRFHPKAVDDETIFEIGSITKLFTATMLADAVARGEVRLDDPIQSLLPGTLMVPQSTAAITLRQLATHRSGLPTTPDNLCSTKIREPFACYDVARLYDFLGHFTLPREPGAAWEYSNPGYGLLGHLLARRAGRSYEALLRERVLDPLGMPTTREIPLAADTDRVASGYSGAVASPPFRMPALEGAGVLRSSVDDLLTFLEYQLGFRESPLSAALQETHVLQASTSYPGVSIGLGWLMVPLANGQVLQHDGETPGFTAFIGFHPLRQVGVVILSNARVNTYSGVGDVGFHLLDSTSPLAAITRPASVPASFLNRCLGVYRTTSGDAFEVGIAGDRLVLYHVASDFDMTLYPQSDTRFSALDLEVGAGASALFRTNASGTVTQLDWTQNGRTLAYPRREEPTRLAWTRNANRLVLSLTGGDTDVTYTIEASTNLVAWETIGTLRGSGDRLTDPGAEARPSRFYRAARVR